MFTKTVTYKDYNGNTRTETHYFNFTEAELAEMEMSAEGGFAARVQRIMDANNKPELIQIIKKFILDAYGIKSDDGRRFMKSDEIRQAFIENPAYSEIFMELATNAEAAADFVNRVAPEGIRKNIPAAIPAAT